MFPTFAPPPPNPDNSLAPAGTGFVCGPEIPASRRLLSSGSKEKEEKEEEKQKEEEEKQGEEEAMSSTMKMQLYKHRELNNDTRWTVETCYYACFDRLAPDNGKYKFECRKCFKGIEQILTSFLLMNRLFCYQHLLERYARGTAVHLL